MCGRSGVTDQDWENDEPNLRKKFIYTRKPSVICNSHSQLVNQFVVIIITFSDKDIFVLCDVIQPKRHSRRFQLFSVDKLNVRCSHCFSSISNENSGIVLYVLRCPKLKRLFCRKDFVFCFLFFPLCCHQRAGVGQYRSSFMCFVLVLLIYCVFSAKKSS